MKLAEKIEDYFTSDERALFPSIINLEVYRGKCPCKCVHCPVGKTKLNQRTEYFGEESIKPELYKKVADEISLHPNSVLRIHSVGEPILWEDIGACVEYAHKKDVQEWLFTSLITTDISLLKHLCKNVNIIEVSANNINEEEYIQEKGIDGFQTVLQNISIMREYINTNKLNCRLLVSRVQTLFPDKDNAFIEFWRSSGLVDDVFVRSYHTYNNLLEDRFDCREKNRGCMVHWLRFNINVKGLAVVCFNELFKNKISDEIVLGNVNNQSISEIWKSDYLNKIRCSDLNGTYAQNGFSSTFPCIKCKSCTSIKKATNISEQQLNRTNKGEE